jgi:hypothetical protein
MCVGYFQAKLGKDKFFMSRATPRSEFDVFRTVGKENCRIEMITGKVKRGGEWTRKFLEKYKSTSL